MNGADLLEEFDDGIQRIECWKIGDDEA